MDQKGFVFSDSSGRIYISSEVVQHTGDELGIKDLWLDGTSRLSMFAFTDLNSTANPDIGLLDMRNDGTIHKRSPRGVLGLEAVDHYRGGQFFVRGSIGIKAETLTSPEVPELAIALGFRRRF